jgi:hypothetical protein
MGKAKNRLRSTGVGPWYPVIPGYDREHRGVMVGTEFATNEPVISVDTKKKELVVPSSDHDMIPERPVGYALGSRPARAWHRRLPSSPANLLVGTGSRNSGSPI